MVRRSVPAGAREKEKEKEKDGGRTVEEKTRDRGSVGRRSHEVAAGSQTSERGNGKGATRPGGRGSGGRPDEGGGRG